MIDVRRIDTSTTLFGERYASPIAIAPTGRNQAFHAEGELAVARGARAGDHPEMLSTVASTGVEAVNEARGRPVWYQLYARYNWEITEALVQRAEAAGCPAIVLTVDLQGGSNRETNKRFAKLDDRECSVCHEPEFQDYIRTKPMFDGLDVPEMADYGRSLSWDFVRRLRDITKGKLLIKGIVRGDDALVAAENGVDGIVVSNHGGRAEASGRSTIECLPEVVAAAGDRLTILVDGGFRRGTDVFKALALGADAVCVGRPYLWGLASFGQPGVEAVLSILRAELELVMRQMGTTSLDRIAAPNPGLLREVDAATGAKSVFILSGIPGAVGSASRQIWSEIHRSRRPLAVWPYEADLEAMPPDRPVLAEQYPRLFYPALGGLEGPKGDRSTRERALERLPAPAPDEGLDWPSVPRMPSTPWWVWWA